MSMNILLVHNAYQQWGGEDTVFEQELAMLRDAGHRVATYRRSNHEIEDYGPLNRLALVRETVWSETSRRDFARVLARQEPDIVHVHNTFQVISPSIYWACYDAQVPVVQTLHNYRLFCPSGDFLRRGEVCEECVEHSLWRSVRYACYRHSRTQSAVVATMLAYHRHEQTWTRCIDTYIALSEFARQKFIAAGLPADRVVVKPNFVHPDPGSQQSQGEYAIFVGRLSAEKGVQTLISAWVRLATSIPLVVVGDGPLYEDLRTQATERVLNCVVFKGRMPREATLEAIKRARFLILPSECYENFPLTIPEAYACGVPVIAAAIGALQELVEDEITGVKFRVGDAADLAEKVEWAWTHPERTSEMGRRARRTYEEKYTGKKNYLLLKSIYDRVLAQRGSATGAAVPSRSSENTD
jgi:glycosyltransferase involved in cell wall biosynthesis